MSRLRRVGKFTVLEPIGSGGFSTVYKVREDKRGSDDSKNGGPLYAMKIGNAAVNDEYNAVKSVDEMTHMEEWRAYKALSFGKGDANRSGIPEVYETGDALQDPRWPSDCRLDASRNRAVARKGVPTVSRDAVTRKVRRRAVGGSRGVM